MGKSILLVDDHKVVLRGLQAIVSDALGPDTDTDTATSGHAVLNLLRNKDYDVCVLDIELPDLDGKQLLHTLKTNYPDMRVIVHTVHNQIWYMKEFLSADADGVIFKDADIDEIAAAIKKVAEGGRYYCHAARVLRNIVSSHDTPTPREQQVLYLLAKGATTDEIAAQIGVSPHTVEFHRRHLLEKFKARNTAGLIVTAIAQGFLPVSSQ